MLDTRHLLATGSLLCSALAWSQAPPPGPANAPPAANAEYKWDFAPLVKELDTDHSGTISLNEWKSAGICESIYHLLHPAASGDLTAAEIEAHHPQPEADTDHTHQLTVKKMIWVCNAGPKGPPPSAAAPAAATPPSP